LVNSPPESRRPAIQIASGPRILADGGADKKAMAPIRLPCRLSLSCSAGSLAPRRLNRHWYGMTPVARARQVFAIEIAAIRAVQRRLDQQFDAAVRLITHTLDQRGKLVIVGIGKSGNIGRKLAATFSSTGCPAVVLDPVDALHGDLGIVADGDLVLALSYSGESEELVGLLPGLKRFAVKFIALTGGLRSTLARYSDVVLDVRVPREACPFNLAPTASTTAALVMGDALALAVMQARGFRERDFALRHPSGAIGRALLTKVGDIMRRGERNAVAPMTLTVKEALLVMTRAKSGSVAVINAGGKLAGVFTDGDLRRRMPGDPEILSRSLRSVMTPKPIHIREDALAVEALKIFHARNIDDLIVINTQREPVGLVDIQDLPKLKLL